MDTKSPPHCCYLFEGDVQKPCPSSSEWMIWTPPDIYDVTESCTTHVGELLSDAKEFRVYPLVLEHP